MTMHDTTTELEIQTFNFEKGADIDAPIDITWDAVLAELGPEGTMPDETGENVRPYPFVFEARPGGRWYRDLGNNTGHLWGHVQVIKPPKLLEIAGPMFLSFPGTNHIQYRLTAEGEQTHLRMTHRAFGYFPKNYMDGAEIGWAHGVRRISEIAARMKQQRGAKR